MDGLRLTALPILGKRVALHAHLHNGAVQVVQAGMMHGVLHVESRRGDRPLRTTPARWGVSASGFTSDSASPS